MNPTPIFIIGVPRSGTTLLRTMLDSHPNIASGPETPWLSPHQPRSIGALVEYLCTDKHGFVASYGGSRAEVIGAARAFADSLLGGYAARRGKGRWAEKTPENLLHLPFITELFPGARFIHLTRDALDVALSTSVVAEHRKGISETLESTLKLAPGLEVDNTVFNAALRHGHWERKIETGLSDRSALKVAYEDLVRSPEPTMRRVLEFVGEPFDPAVLDYAQAAHDQPGWEWGSADVAHLAKTAGGITPERAGRAQRELSPLEIELLAPLAGRPSRPLAASITGMASPDEINSESFTRFTGWTDGLAKPLGLRTCGGGPDAWTHPWLWLNALAGLRWPGSRLVALHCESSPLPWLAALLGAHVTFINADARALPLLQRLRAGLGVRVDWKAAEAGKVPLPEESTDVVISFAATGSQTIAPEAARVLKPGGILALTVGSDAGATPSGERPAAMTLRDFEDRLWLLPAFGNRERPVWIGASPPPTADASIGAAVLRKA